MLPTFRLVKWTVDSFYINENILKWPMNLKEFCLFVCCFYSNNICSWVAQSDSLSDTYFYACSFLEEFCVNCVFKVQIWSRLWYMNKFEIWNMIHENYKAVFKGSVCTLLIICQVTVTLAKVNKRKFVVFDPSCHLYRKTP